MTSTKEMNSIKKSYKKKFTVEIDLSDCDDYEIKQILEHLYDEDNNVRMDSWMVELRDIIKND